MTRIFLLLSASVSLLANHTNPPLAKTGAPGDGSCAECHTGMPDNPGNVILVFPQFTYRGGVRQTISVSISPTRQALIGSQFTARLASNPLLPAGHIETSAPVSVSTDPTTGIEYATSTTATFTFDWTPPPATSGDVIFYITTVAGDSNGHPDANVYTGKFRLRPATARDLPSGFRSTTIDVTGASSTTPTAISNDGQVVGNFREGSQLRGFWRKDGAMYLFDAQPGVATFPKGVNNAGQIVGYFSNEIGGNATGFVRNPSNGVITPFSVPGATSTMLTGINDAGLITGSFIDSAGASHILTLTNLNAFNFVDLGSYASSSGIASDGSITGFVVTGRTPAFSGSIVGGFVRTPDGAFSITTPCSPGTRGGGVTGLFINANQDIVGGCSSNTSGIIFSSRFMQAPNGRVYSESAGIYSSTGYAGINDSGQIVAMQDYHGVIMTPCSISPTATSFSVAAAGGALSVNLTSAFPDCRPTVFDLPNWISLSSDIVSGVQTLFLQPNADGTPRSATIHLAGTDVTVTQAGAPCTAVLTGGPATFTGSGGAGTLTITIPTGCTWTASPGANWITLTTSTGTSTATIPFSVAANPLTVSRTAAITVGSQQFAIIQGASICTFALTPSTFQFSAQGGNGTITVTTGPACSWSASSSDSWVTVPLTFAPTVGNGTVTFTVTANPGASGRAATITIGTSTATVAQQGTGGISGLRFVPIAPCRLTETRPGYGRGPGDPFGPPSLSAAATRDFPIPLSTYCSIPAAAKAYSLNITVVPSGPLAYLTAWPTGQPRPQVSTLNSFNGRVVANAAIVPAGTNGAISVYVTGATDLIIDINGYFVGPEPGIGLAFYPVTPCRVADTRSTGGKTGEYGPPSLAFTAPRTISIRNSGCGIPASAEAFALNFTAIPSGYLGYFAAGPGGGGPIPNSSILNSWDGQVVANMAIVRSGAGGTIGVISSDPTDIVIDINGYFAPPGTQGALTFNTVFPCRAVDTRLGEGKSGSLGPPIIEGRTFRSLPIPLSGCAPADARAYSLNLTAVPPDYLGFLTAWPSGAPQPFVSTLNSWNGQVVANGALLPAGTGGAISVYVSNPSHVIVDINGYFAP